MKKEEYTLSDGTQSYILTPDVGKVLVRKSDGLVLWSSFPLFYRNDGTLEEIDDYEEQDAPVVDNSEMYAKCLEEGYKNTVERYIREKYTVSDELALLRQRDSKADEYNEYYTYCEACKTRAKEELGL